MFDVTEPTNENHCPYKVTFELQRDFGVIEELLLLQKDLGYFTDLVLQEGMNFKRDFRCFKENELFIFWFLFFKAR